MYDDNASLVQACLDGDQDAFAFLVNRYQGAIYAYTLHKTSDEQEAKDITQEVLLKAYLKLGQLKQPHQFQSWLYTIASNECRMWQRRHKPHEAMEDCAEPIASTSSTYDDPETRLTVKEAIDALPESQRLVVLMHYFSGFSLKEIGEFLGTSRDVIKGRLFRARQQMGTRLKTTFEEYFRSRVKPDFCIAILDRISSLPIPSAPHSSTLKPHRYAPIPLAGVLSFMLFAGLASLFAVGAGDGVSQEYIGVALVEADSAVEVSQAAAPKKKIGRSDRQIKIRPQSNFNGSIPDEPVQVIGNGRIDDIAVAPDGKLFVVQTPFGLELRRVGGQGQSITLDTAEKIGDATFSRDSRFLVWHSREKLSVWDVQNQEMVATHSFERKFLFHIGLEFATDLDNRLISNELRSVFADHGLRLSNNVFFPYSGRNDPRLLNQGDWILADSQTHHVFAIRQEEDQLSVYSNPNSWNFILGMALHPEAKEVTVALPLNMIMFIDPISGDWLRSFEWNTNGDPIDLMQYSPDGKQLVIFESGSWHEVGNLHTSRPHRIFILEAQSGEILHEFSIPPAEKRHLFSLISFAYSPDSRWLALRAWEERRVEVYDTVDWTVKKVFKTIWGGGSYPEVSFSPDGSNLALGGQVWDFETGEEVRGGKFWPYAQWVDNTHLVVGDWTSLQTLEITENRTSPEMISEPINLAQAYFLSDNAHIFTIGDGLSLWEVSTARKLEADVFPENESWFRFAAISPVAPQVAIPSAERPQIYIWDPIKQEVVHRIPFEGKLPYALAFSPDGKKIAVGESWYTAKLWNISAGKELHRFVNAEESPEPHEPNQRNDPTMIRALAFSADGRRLACGGKFDAIWIWDTKTGKQIRQLVLPMNLPELSRTEKPVKDVNLANGSYERPNSPMFLKFSPDGERLFAGLASGHVVVFELRKGWVVKTFVPGYLPKTPDFVYPIAIAFNPATTLMASGTDHVVIVFETEMWETVAELEGHRAQISSVDFSHDGTKLLSASNDGTMRIWKIAGLE